RPHTGPLAKRGNTMRAHAWAAGLAGCLILCTATPALADGGQDDPVGALYAAADNHGVEPQTLIRLAWCESRFSPTARGDHGRSRGLVQLSTLDTGLYWHFLSVGYGDADDAEQAADYLARVASGEWRDRGITLRRWSCYG